MGGDVEPEQIDSGGVVLLAQRIERLGDGSGDLGDVEFGDFPVAFLDLVHGESFRPLCVEGRLRTRRGAPSRKTVTPILPRIEDNGGVNTIY